MPNISPNNVQHWCSEKVRFVWPPCSVVKILFENVRRCLTKFKNFTKLFHCSQCSVKCCMRLTTLPNISSNNLIHFYIFTVPLWWRNWACRNVRWNVRCIWPPSIELWKVLAFFPTSMFGEMFGTFDRGFTLFSEQQLCYTIWLPEIVQMGRNNKASVMIVTFGDASRS